MCVCVCPCVCVPELLFRSRTDLIYAVAYASVKNAEANNKLFDF